MPAKLIENSLFTQVFEPKSRTATATLYRSDGTTGNGLDTRDADEVVFQVEVGAIAAAATLDISIVAGATDDASLASAITDAEFTQITNANQNTARLVSVQAKNFARYMWAKVVQGGTGATLYAITATQGKQDRGPVANTVDADV